MSPYKLLNLLALTSFCFLCQFIDINADVPGYMRGANSPESRELRRIDQPPAASDQITPQLQSIDGSSSLGGTSSSWSTTGGSYFNQPTDYSDTRNSYYFNQPGTGFNTSADIGPAGGWNTTTGWGNTGTGTGTNVPTSGWNTKEPRTNPNYNMPYRYNRGAYYNRYNYVPHQQYDSIDRLYEQNLQRMRQEHGK